MAPHLDPIMRCLVDDFGHLIDYVATDTGDPRLARPGAGIESYCVGRGLVLPWFCKTLKAALLVSTTPGLGQGPIQRSAYPVHYAYIHHAMVSTHMIYGADAFDHFDSIFCTGPHHERETRAREVQAGLPAKLLVRHGNARLDELLSRAADKPSPSAPVLVAPSWGPRGLLETCGLDTIGCLLDVGCEVLLRPHPETLHRTPAVVDGLCRRFAGQPGFHYRPDVSAVDALLQSRLMISDWSGAALEFGLGLERPVIFVDVPRKVNNPDYQALELPPIEVELRPRIGRIVSTDALASLPRLIAEMSAEDRTATRRTARQETVFNPGDSVRAAAQAIDDIYNTPGPKR